MKKIEIGEIEWLDYKRAHRDEIVALARAFIGTKDNLVQVEWVLAADRTYAVLSSTTRTVEARGAWKIGGEVVRFTGIYARGDQWGQFMWPPSLPNANDVVLREHLRRDSGDALDDWQIELAEKELREMADIASNSIIIKALDVERWMKRWVATKNSLDKNRAVLQAFYTGDGSLGDIRANLESLIDGDLRRMALMEEHIKDGILDKEVLAKALKNPNKEIRVLIIGMCKDMGRKKVRGA